jgi:primosomal protein N' (replication factor Y)
MNKNTEQNCQKDFFYEIALPIRVAKNFTYKHHNKLKPGTRVVVSFNHTHHTGIVWIETQPPQTNYKIKNVLEVVDKEPALSSDILQLAGWISQYYAVSYGQALAAMLPAAFNIQVQQKVKLTTKSYKHPSKEVENLITQLKVAEWTEIKELKENSKLNNFQFWLEFLEADGIIEIKRSFDRKIKKKVANFVILSEVEEIPKLTKKQNEAYTYMQNIGKDFALAKIAKVFSYSIVKALRNKGLLTIEPREIETSFNFKKQPPKPKNIKLTEEQYSAIEAILQAMQQKIFRTFLLYGITGSGKTEVYIQVIKQALQQEKSALMLVPEISLTPQMVERFFAAFGQEIAILHSHLNDRQRWQEWKKIRSGKCKIVIGARSAIFAPLQNIGVVIVDEEHEGSYKQDQTPRYNGRDIAIVRAKQNNAVVILGSATPSLESWQNTLREKYTLLTLEKRPLAYQLPSVNIIDMRSNKEPESSFSQTLLNKIEARLQKKEQIILLQNRRGHSSFVQCLSCGKLFECSNCDVSMNFHSQNQKLVCHYCGLAKPMPRKCPQCGSYLFRFGASGTQQLEKELHLHFPNAKVLRMDSDTAHRKESYNLMFQNMRQGNVDILLGTQMIAKGLDFHNVTLVGVVSADIGLNIPDFRASERTFQLLTQVAGRAGRGEKAGEVVIQTYNPEHYAIDLAMQQNFRQFAEEELALRKALNYPPFHKLARILITSSGESDLKRQINRNRRHFEYLRRQFPGKITVLGPIETPMPRLQNKYRQHVIIKAPTVKIISQATNFLRKNLKFSAKVKYIIDIDPYSLL